MSKARSESFSDRFRRSLFKKEPSQALLNEINTTTPLDDQWSTVDSIPWMENPIVSIL